MLSYRHAYHAGNFADVLKHLILQRILAHLIKKESPFCCIDTHAGAGGYSLNHAYALKNKEYAQGIGKVWQREDLPDCMTDYVRHIAAFNRLAQLSSNQPLDSSTLDYYPGSPLLIQTELRRHDRLCCYELHSADVKELADTLGKDARVTITSSDGLTASLKLLPPRERRGLVFMDPSYELKQDYSLVVDALHKMHHRFATGVYALWYPVINRQRNHSLEHAIKATGIKNIQLFELGITADHSGTGMTSSGMIIINPPWTLETEMRQALPWLAKILRLDAGSHFRIEQLASE